MGHSSSEPSIVQTTQAALKQLHLAHPGRPVLLITAGATCEDIDDVRYLTNRSTGSIGLALAIEAERRHIPHLLLLGSTALPSPKGCPTVRFRSAQDLHDAVHEAFKSCSYLIMSAAVSDYTPCDRQQGKHKKSGDDWVLRLRRTPDILQSLVNHPNRQDRFVIGFALEECLDEAEGQRKLSVKNLDALLLNTTEAFGPGQAQSTLLLAGGARKPLGVISKESLASVLIDTLPL